MKCGSSLFFSLVPLKDHIRIQSLQRPRYFFFWGLSYKKKRWRDNIIKKLSDKFLYLSTVHVTTNVSVPITGWNNKLFPASHYLCNFTLMKTIIICFRCFKWQFRKNSLPNFQIIFFWRAEYIYLSNILCCEISLLQTCKFCFSQVYFLTFHTLSSP